MERPEILAPAGDLDCLRAAVENGADAVYFGLQGGFNARARATNFDLESLPAVMDDLHAREVAPGLDVHASTQMTITSAEGAEFARRCGASRVILARELSLQEIAAIHAKTAVELEVFVHGALCVSYSGQCLTSEAWGGRSANRGQCAQSCRMPYELIVDGRQQDLGDVRYLLSPKDLAGVRAVPDLLRIGVHGLK